MKDVNCFLVISNTIKYINETTAAPDVITKILFAKIPSINNNFLIKMAVLIYKMCEVAVASFMNIPFSVVKT